MSLIFPEWSSPRRDRRRDQMLQHGRREGQTVPVVIKTHMAKERDVQTALREINRKSLVSEPTVLIRVEGKDE